MEREGSTALHQDHRLRSAQATQSRPPRDVSERFRRLAPHLAGLFICCSLIRTADYGVSVPPVPPVSVLGSATLMLVPDSAGAALLRTKPGHTKRATRPTAKRTTTATAQPAAPPSELGDAGVFIIVAIGTECV